MVGCGGGYEEGGLVGEWVVECSQGIAELVEGVKRYELKRQGCRIGGLALYWTCFPGFERIELLAHRTLYLFILLSMLCR